MFFRDVADCEGLRSSWVLLPQPVLGSEDIEVAPSIQVKLREKHRVSLDDVHNAFMTRLSEPMVTDFQDRRRRNIIRHFLKGYAIDGRELKVIFDFDTSENTLFLVTAHEERHNLH